MAKKELIVVNNIKQITKGTDRKAATIEISLQYPHYLSALQVLADDLVDKLFKQQNGSIDDIKIKGLALVWNEDSD